MYSRCMISLMPRYEDVIFGVGFGRGKWPEVWIISVRHRICRNTCQTTCSPETIFRETVIYGTTVQKAFDNAARRSGLKQIIAHLETGRNSMADR